jgi:site-specific recombinase XerD
MAFQRSIDLAYDKVTDEFYDADLVFQVAKEGYKLRKQYNSGKLNLFCCRCGRSALDLQSGTVTVQGKGGKHRMIQLCNPDGLFTLGTYCTLFASNIAANCDYLLVNRLGNKLSDQSIRILVGNLAELAKMSKKVTSHVLRHTFAALLLENDADINISSLCLAIV